MFRVMIVDDEQIIRDGLIGFIDWKSLECIISATATNGLEARNILQCEDIDIVLADIRMPGFNGIELAEYIYDNFPYVKIIMLTGYADFSYAQSAIKYSVVSFIIKTNPLEKIIEAVEKAKKLILQEREKDTKIRFLQKKISNNLPEIKSKFLYDLLNNLVLDKDEIQNRSEELDINVSNYFVILFKINKEVKEDNSTSSDMDYDRFKSSINNFLSLALKDYNPNIVYIDNTHICAITSVDTNVYSDCIKNINSACKNILDIVNNFMDFSVEIGVSYIHYNINNLNCAYNEASAVLEKRVFTTCPIYFYLPEDKLKKFADSYLDSSKNKSSFSIKEALIYIELNYQKDISLQSIADHVHLNSSYLSRQFKKETGETVIELLTQYRIVKAKELLTNRCIKNFEVAYQVGINDPAYFSNIFKKHTGLSPKSWSKKYTKR